MVGEEGINRGREVEDFAKLCIEKIEALFGAYSQLKEVVGGLSNKVDAVLEKVGEPSTETSELAEGERREITKAFMKDTKFKKEVKEEIRDEINKAIYEGFSSLGFQAIQGSDIGYSALPKNIAGASMPSDSEILNAGWRDGEIHKLAKRTQDINQL